MKNGNLFIHTIASLIQQRINESYPDYFTLIQFTESRKEKQYIISMSKYGLARLSIHIKYSQNSPLSKDSKIQFEFKKINTESDTMEVQKGKSNYIETSLKNLVANTNKLFEKVFEKLDTFNLWADLFCLIKSQYHSSDELLVKLSSDLVLNSFLKGDAHVKLLRQQTNRMIEFIESRPKSDRNIVYMIFFCLVNIHLTTNLAERQERLITLRKTYVATLIWRRLSFVPDLPKNPLPFLMSGKKQLYSSDAFISFFEIYSIMKID
jgi:hypothetical protein